MRRTLAAAGPLRTMPLYDVGGFSTMTSLLLLLTTTPVAAEASSAPDPPIEHSVPAWVQRAEEPVVGALVVASADAGVAPVVSRRGGRVTVRLTATPKASEHTPRWSPDGRYLAFLSARDGKSQVWLLDVASGSSRRHLGGSMCMLMEPAGVFFIAQSSFHNIQGVRFSTQPRSQAHRNSTPVDGDRDSTGECSNSATRVRTLRLRRPPAAQSAAAAARGEARACAQYG